MWWERKWRCMNNVAMLVNFYFICVAILVSRFLGAPRYRYRQSTTYVLAITSACLARLRRLPSCDGKGCTVFSKQPSVFRINVGWSGKIWRARKIRSLERYGALEVIRWVCLFIYPSAYSYLWFFAEMPSGCASLEPVWISESFRHHFGFWIFCFWILWLDKYFVCGSGGIKHHQNQ